MVKSTNMLITEIKEDLTEGRAISCGLTGRFNILKLAILFKLIYKLNIIYQKLQWAFFFCRNKQANSKIYMKNQKPRRAKAILLKKGIVGRFI